MHIMSSLAVAATCWILMAIASAAGETIEEFRTPFLAGKLTWQQVLDRARREGKVTFSILGRQRCVERLDGQQPRPGHGSTRYKVWSPTD